MKVALHLVHSIPQTYLMEKPNSYGKLQTVKTGMIYEEQCNSENTLHRAKGKNAFSMNNLIHHVEKQTCFLN